MVRPASHGERTRTIVSRPLLGAVAGLLVGVAAAVAVAATTTAGNTHHRAAVLTPAAAAGAYVAAWERSQLGTWRVVLRWERRAGSGRLSDEVRIAQRPPDRLAVGAGAVDARRGDRVLACAAAPDGQLRCRDAGAAPSYAEQVARQAAVLRGEVTGTGALYGVVAAGPGCYELRLRFPAFPAPPFGRRARFCFDATTGAPTLLDIERAEGRDRQIAVEVSGTVTDGDLAPPSQADGDPGTGGSR